MAIAAGGALGMACPLAAEVPTIEVEVRVASELVGCTRDGDEGPWTCPPDFESLAGEAATRVAESMGKRRFAFLNWVGGATTTPAARLIAVVSDGSIDGCTPLMLELVASLGGGEFAITDNATELYGLCHPDPPFIQQDLSGFRDDLVLEIEALIENEDTRLALAGNVLAEITLADIVEADGIEKKLKIPLALTELQADQASEIGVRFEIEREDTDGSLGGSLSMNPDREVDGWTRCNLSRFEFSPEEIASAGWHPRVPEILAPERLLEVKVFMATYVPKLSAPPVESDIVIGEGD